ncbi:MAG TPA: hypothetical protein VKQ34_04645 [Candidatus Saccharimonadales bacterium]|nr:hypothetical protein [Candidatus Saccharimonadales bacterium]
MYEGGKGVGPVATGGGAILLPNTGGNSLLTFVAITAIVIGVAIMVSTLVRFIAKRVYQA